VDLIPCGHGRSGHRKPGAILDQSFEHPPGNRIALVQPVASVRPDAEQHAVKRGRLILLLNLLSGR
jgi:hypothetical protein